MMCPQTGKVSTAKEVCFMNNPTHKYTRTLTIPHIFCLIQWIRSVNCSRTHRSCMGAKAGFSSVKDLWIRLLNTSRWQSTEFVTVPGGSLRDVVNLGWPIAPSYMRPNAGGGKGGFACLSQWARLCTWSYAGPRSTAQESIPGWELIPGLLKGITNTGSVFSV
jgi:hypothetical protein